MSTIQCVRSMLLPEVQDYVRAIKQCTNAIDQQIEFAKKHNYKFSINELILGHVMSMHRASALLCEILIEIIYGLRQDEMRLKSVIIINSFNGRPNECDEYFWDLCLSTTLQTNGKLLIKNDIIRGYYHTNMIADYCLSIIEGIDSENYLTNALIDEIRENLKKLEEHINYTQKFFRIFLAEVTVH